jgi:predicted nuclease of predicted toxin-antitoxin system
VRFFLDNDVDATLAEQLREAGHEAWTSAQAGRGTATDDSQTIYAMDKQAVLVTHDREFTTRRKAMPHGHHVRLRCHQIDGAALMMAALPELLQVLQAGSTMVIEISPGRRSRPELRLSFGD